MESHVTQTLKDKTERFSKDNNFQKIQLLKQVHSQIIADIHNVYTAIHGSI